MPRIAMGRREKQVVTPEPQPPPHRREEKEPYVGGENRPPKYATVVPTRLSIRSAKTPPCVGRCRALVKRAPDKQNAYRGKHDRRADDAVGKAGEASHHQGSRQGPTTVQITRASFA